MADPTRPGPRRALAALLIIALALSGVGRPVAATLGMPGTRLAIAGLWVPICHAGGPDVPAGPGRPAGHGCCDACALLAPVVLPVPPVVSAPAPVASPAARAWVAASAPAGPRWRGPRQSRGPPAA